MPPRWRRHRWPIALLAGSARRLARGGSRGCLAACPYHCPTAQRPEDKARSAATNRPGRPAKRGRTGRQQGPKRTPGAEEAGGRARKAAQRASERRRPQTSTREPGQKPPNSCQQAPPAKNGRDRRDGRRERAGRPQAPEEPDKGPGREKARAGGDADKDRTPTCARGGGPGSGSAQPGRPDEQSRAARPIGARGKARAQEPRARARRQNTTTADQQAKEPGAAPARQRTGRAANGNRESSQVQPGAERAARQSVPGAADGCAACSRRQREAPLTGGPNGAGRRWRSDTIPCLSGVPSDRFQRHGSSNSPTSIYNDRLIGIFSVHFRQRGLTACYTGAILWGRRCIT